MSANQQNLYQVLRRGFPADRARPLLATPQGVALSYEQIEQQSARLANFLAGLGLRPGDRVTVQMPKSPATVSLYLACLRAGFVYQPLNDSYTKEEIARLLADARPALAVCHPRAQTLFRELTRDLHCRVLTADEDGDGTLRAASDDGSTDFPAVQRGADDLAVLLYTSGTTGAPKGAMITHGNLAANARALVAYWGFSAADRLLHALPMYHAHGLFVGLGCTLLSGASMLFLPRFDARETLRWLPHCTVMMGVPTYYSRLLAESGLSREVCRGMRLFISGSAPLSPQLFAAFRERTGHAIVERYGMTETGMNTSNPLRGERRAGSVGLPLPGVDLRIAAGAGEPVAAGSAGEIQVAGPNVFAGYWQQPEKRRECFTADGFFRTGDLGYLSADGYLTIAGRSRDLVITGGLNVYPREVENVLESLPGVRESAVIGVPHPDFGEGVIAVVVPAADAMPDEHSIVLALRQQLASFKIPKRIFFVRELPRNVMGKIEKPALRGRYAGTFHTGDMHE